MAFEVAERTLSPEVATLLERLLGSEIAKEGVLPDRTQFDFFLILNGYKIIVELKIGGLQKLPLAIAQAEEYKEKINASGIIVIIYPDETRKIVTRPEDVREIAEGFRPSVMVLCPFLKNYYPQTSLAELAHNLKESLAKPTEAPSVALVVETLRQTVMGISLEIKRSAGIDSPIIKETVGSLVLFEILAEENEKADKQVDEEVTAVVSDLAAYILVNQLLLHRILTKILNLEEKLERISVPIELNHYFKKIQDIDYKAVYCINIADNIPVSATNEINTAITAIRAIQPENLQHDLLGRIFHEFLPFETRKQLGTFYTRPQAAEILAGLAIDRADEKVLDPACGSGTLLVAAYRKKMLGGKGRSHRKLVEEEITGVDIMPFAAHLAALNLTMQSPSEPTNKTRIGIGNALTLVKGSEISGLAKWIQTFGSDVTSADSEKPLTKGESFELEPVNVVIMNPPFTRKERLTAQMKGIWPSVLGEQNYWAYFVALADLLLRKNGKIAAVLPRDFFRGEYSRKVREFLFKDGKYCLKYVVKTTKDWAFSENALFRDYLIVLQKTDIKPKCAFVYLKKKLMDININDAAGISMSVKLVKEGESFEDELFFITWKNQSEIVSNWQDLGHLLSFNTNSGEKLGMLYSDAIKRGGEKLLRFNGTNPHIPVFRGLTPWVQNLLNLIFIVRPISADRIQHSKLILNSENEQIITCTIKDFGATFDISRKVLERGLKTASYISRLDVESLSDFAIVKPFSGLKEIQTKLNVTTFDFNSLIRRANTRFSHLLISRRFDFSSPGTKLVSFFSNAKLLPGEAFWTLPSDVTTSKQLSLWLNSTFAFIELLMMQRETRGSFIDITMDKIGELHIPNLQKGDSAILLEAFEKVRQAEFPPIFQQFENPPEARQIIDRAVLKFIGYTDGEIDALLPELYTAMATELRSWRELMHKSSSKKSQPSLQMHLLPTG
jgi:tRNA1(Val) A37 N6-methylase TrmN6